MAMEYNPKIGDSLHKAIMAVYEAASAANGIGDETLWHQLIDVQSGLTDLFLAQTQRLLNEVTA